MMFSFALLAVSAAAVAIAAPQPVARANVAPIFAELQASCASGAVAAISYQDFSSTTVASGSCLAYTNAAGSPYDQIVLCKPANCALSFDAACSAGISSITLPVVPPATAENNAAQGTITMFGAQSAVCTA